jgi:hypothetical protein
MADRKELLFLQTIFLNFTRSFYYAQKIIKRQWICLLKLSRNFPTQNHNSSTPFAGEKFLPLQESFNPRI